MHDLTLIGVHEDGEHLLLADADGARYRLALDESLRAAARRDRPRLGQLQIEIEGGLRPRDVQALIRSGMSATEVADRSGWTVEKVRKFEGPVLAEREHIAARARLTSVDRDGAAHPTLDERAIERFRGRGVDRSAVEWDSHRQESGQWIVTVTFPAGGRQRTASWKYDPATSTLRAQNDDARWLGEDDKVGAVPVPHVAPSHRAGDEVFDVTAPANGPARARPRPADPAPMAAAGEDELTSSIRAHHSQIRDRRGRRRGHAADVPGQAPSPVDALPLQPLAFDLEDVEPPPARPRPGDEEHSEHGSATDPATPADRPDEVPGPAIETAPEISAPGATPLRKGRPRVPAWEDVVFGARTHTSTPDDPA